MYLTMRWLYVQIRAEDYARKYQWPNSFCSSPTYMVSTAEAATRGNLVVENIEQFALRTSWFDMRTDTNWNHAYRLRANPAWMGHVSHLSSDSQHDLMWYVWFRRFQETWGPDVIQSLIKCQPSLADDDNLAIFKRKWEYMYIYAEIGFARGYLGLHHFTFVRQVNLIVYCCLSTLTRLRLRTMGLYAVIETELQFATSSLMPTTPWLTGSPIVYWLPWH